MPESIERRSGQTMSVAGEPRNVEPRPCRSAAKADVQFAVSCLSACVARTSLCRGFRLIIWFRCAAGNDRLPFYSAIPADPTAAQASSYSSE